jgi:hypothetical protein
MAGCITSWEWKFIIGGKDESVILSPRAVDGA